MSKQHLVARTKALKAKAAKRTEQAIELLATGKGITQVARELGVNRKTLYTNLKKLEKENHTKNLDNIERLRVRHHNELRTMVDFLLNSADLNDAEVLALFRLYQADIAKLCGLNKEKAATNVAVITTDTKQMGLYQRFLHESAGVRDFEPVWALLRSLPRERAAIEPPDDAESWNDEVKQLSEGK
jgi:transposase-like protein